VDSGLSPDKISQSPNKQWMQFDASSSELESLLNTEYHIYEHAATGKLSVACNEYVDIIPIRALADDGPDTMFQLIPSILVY